MKSINTNSAPAAVGPYSQAIEVGNTVYLSGQLPIDPLTGTFVEGGIKELTRQAFRNIEAVLSEARLSLNNIAKVTVMLADMADFAEMNEVYAEFFAAPYPARSAFAVKTLPKNSRIEIECIAVRPTPLAGSNE